MDSTELDQADQTGSLAAQARLAATGECNLKLAANLLLPVLSLKGSWLAAIIIIIIIASLCWHHQRNQQRSSGGQ